MAGDDQAEQKIKYVLQMIHSLARPEKNQQALYEKNKRPYIKSIPGVMDAGGDGCGYKFCPDCKIIIKNPAAKEGLRTITLTGAELHQIEHHGKDFSAKQWAFLNELIAIVRIQELEQP
jgi:hypothetical protein